MRFLAILFTVCIFIAFMLGLWYAGIACMVLTVLIAFFLDDPHHRWYHGRHDD